MGTLGNQEMILENNGLLQVKVHTKDVELPVIVPVYKVNWDGF